MNVKDLLYFNMYGGFSKNEKEYVIKTNEKCTPAPWSHMMANEEFGTIVTANGGGYTWSKNSRDNKITTWSNDPVTDKPSEKIWIENDEGKRIGAMPYDSLENYEVVFGFGYTRVYYKDENFSNELLIYVPINQNKKVFKYTIENLKNEACLAKVFFEIEPVLGVSREYTKKHLTCEDFENGVVVKNVYRDFYQNEKVVVVSNMNSNINISEEKNIRFLTEILINPKEKTTVIFEICVDKKDDETKEMIIKDNSNEDLKNIENFWNNMLGKIKVRTPVESMNIMLNGWIRLSNDCKQALGKNVVLSSWWSDWF